MKKMIAIFVITFAIIGCGGNSGEAQKNNDQVENNYENHKSIHQEDRENNPAGSENNVKDDNYKITIDQIESITNTEAGNFNFPEFSDDGKYLIFTTNDYNQIWLYSFSNKSLEKIIDLPQCGIDFQFAPNSEDIYFRSRDMKGKNHGGVYSIFKYSISDKKIEMIYSTENRITKHVLINDRIYLIENDSPRQINLENKKVGADFIIPFFYVENNFLIKMTDRKDTVSFSNKNFRFINCEYSKDKECIFVLTANDGIIALDLNGKPINIYDKAGTAKKLFKSNLLVYSVETDDGQKILSSDLFIGFMNSSKTMKLSNEKNELRYNPDWSPTDNKIAYSSNNGTIKILSFNIEKTSK